MIYLDMFDFAVLLSKDLIRHKTVTPDDDGIMEFLKNLFEENGFSCFVEKFSDIAKDAKDTFNLYAEIGSGEKNLCFAGHLDVVPPLKESAWIYHPFEPTVDSGFIYGRGASDMKCAIACFASACFAFLQNNPRFDGKISFLLTGDEEGNSINGTKKMLEFISSKGVKITNCLVGEPTSDSVICDMVKIGRRGSITFNLEIIGKQGHIAYPHLAKNPVYKACEIVSKLKEIQFDLGTEFFLPTNLEVASIETENKTSNIIPNDVSILFNIRFNSLHSGRSIKDKVLKVISENIGDFEFKISDSCSAEAFINEKSDFCNLVEESIFEVTGVNTVFSTTGGTSDARFISKYANTLELGMLNATAHKVNENVSLDDIKTLSDVYYKIVCKYFCIS